MLILRQIITDFDLVVLMDIGEEQVLQHWYRINDPDDPNVFLKWIQGQTFASGISPF
jgi:uncharacterized protein YccT (UPF0319 family)